MKGRIIGLNCGMYNVNAEGVIFNVPAKGIFRVKGLKPMVGDIVEIDEERIIINFVYPRTTELKRPLIANVDQMIIVSSLVEPEFSYLLAFKFLTYAYQNNVKATIVLTKNDKFNNEDKVKEIVDTFNKLNIKVIVTSSKTKEGLEEVRKLFKNNVTCLLGQTGAGKSSLMNAIDPSYSREVGEYSTALNRGKHKTKEVILLPYLDGFIADTPGFSSLDLELYKEDLAQYFPGFNELFTECYFSDCLHVSEKDCAIKKAIENGQIPMIAYESYLKLLSQAIFKKERYSK